ncbi:hypothetical protein EP10_001803 [Geobacillus icigianus]|uniref:Uncharacterized protein n=1 Tax=Geobacillus icigianus TaxID=1430331 RepID=A0ABU6BGM1_9BACL|nr:hypothetical protein [Geobacillus icigianus]
MVKLYLRVNHQPPREPVKNRCHTPSGGIFIRKRSMGSAPHPPPEDENPRQFGIFTKKRGCSAFFGLSPN